MEQGGYVSREGLHNAKADQDYKLAEIIRRSHEARRKVHNRIRPSRELLDQAKSVTDETMREDVQQLRQLTWDYLSNERFMIGLTRRKAILQAKKKAELARPWQTKSWAEREIEKIDAQIAEAGMNAKTKKRRAGLREKMQEADKVLGEINARYDKDWAKLTALDPKAAAIRVENKQILTMLDATRTALSAQMSSAIVRQEMAKRAETAKTDAKQGSAQIQDITQPGRIDGSRVTGRPVASVSRGDGTPRVRIRATLSTRQSSLFNPEKTQPPIIVTTPTANPVNPGAAAGTNQPLQNQAPNATLSTGMKVPEQLSLDSLYDAPAHPQNAKGQTPAAPPEATAAVKKKPRYTFRQKPTIKR